MLKINKDYKVTEINNDYIIIDDILENIKETENYMLNVFNNIEKNNILNLETLSYREILNIDNGDLNNILSLYSKMLINKDFLWDKKLHLKGLKIINKNIDNNKQKWIHTDFCLSALIYVDDIESGGTLIFKKNTKLTNYKSEITLKKLFTIEKNNILYKIEHKKNRLVIFKSNLPHCVWVDDYNKYYDKFRLSIVMFNN